MSKRKTYQLLFFIKRKKLLKSGKAKVFLRISINNQNKELALPCQVDPKIWNSEKAGATGNTKDAKLVNNFIHVTKFKIQEIVNEIELEKEGFEPELIRNKYLGIEPISRTVLGIFSEHNEKIKMQIGKGFSIGTYKRYQVTYNHIFELKVWSGLECGS